MALWSWKSGEKKRFLGSRKEQFFFRSCLPRTQGPEPRTQGHFSALALPRNLAPSNLAPAFPSTALSLYHRTIFPLLLFLAI
ncbi:hypothetical protein BOO33_18125 [Vibrio navarrensis]|nr:hypothetical protein [Vibrio navarrensis]